MTDAQVNQIVQMLGEAVERAEYYCDKAVRVIDNVAPSEDFIRYNAIYGLAVDSSTWLARAAAYLAVLDLLQKRDHTLFARAAATHVALAEVWVERSRISERIMVERESVRKRR